MHKMKRRKLKRYNFKAFNSKIAEFCSLKKQRMSISLQSLFANTRKKIKNKIKPHDRILPIVRGCHRKDALPSGKERRMPRGRRGLSYMLHRWGPWGPITGATSSLAILPQIATLKRGTAPAPAVAGATESADCSVHRLRLATSVSQLEPPRAPSAQPPRKSSLLPRLPLPPSACPRRVIL